MYRREIFELVGGYEKNLRAALDYDLLARLSIAGSGHILSVPLVNYRVHSTNISTQQFLLQRRNAAAIQQRLLAHYGFVFGEDELETHRQATIYGALPDYQIDVESLRRIRLWLLNLQTQNERHNLFPKREFDRVLAFIHNGVFARKNSSITLQDYLRNTTGAFSSCRPSNVVLHLIHSVKNGW